MDSEASSEFPCKLALSEQGSLQPGSAEVQAPRGVAEVEGHSRDRGSAI